MRSTARSTARSTVRNTARLAAATIGLSLCAAPAAPAKSRVLEETVATGGMTTVQLVAGNGEVRILTSPDDHIHIRLEVEPRRTTGDDDRGFLGWFLQSSFENDGALLDAIELSVESVGTTLVLRPLPRGRSRESRIAERWTVAVPARFAVDLALDAAEVEVTGVEGGVQLRQGYGKARIEVPRGDLDLRLQVGDIRARTFAADWARLDLRSRVGGTRVWLDDRRMKYPSPPGPGSFVSLEGRGSDVIRLDVEVGDAELRIE